MKSLKIKFNVAGIAILVMLLNSCYGCPPSLPNKECRDFFGLSLSEQETKFKSYEVSKQVDLYLCGMSLEPPHIGLASYIAEGGEKNVPYLLERLSNEESEINQAYIIGIFRSLSNRGHLKDKQDVIYQLERIASAMQYQPAQEESKRDLKVIRSNINL